MKEVNRNNDYNYFQCFAREIPGGMGICDSCNKGVLEGYLIPVLNSYYCPACFAEWDNDHSYYLEERDTDKRYTDYWRKIFMGGRQS